MPSQIEQIANSGMSSHESLSLSHGFELPHPSLSNPSRLMGLLGPGSEVRSGKLLTALQLTSINPASQPTPGSA